MPAAARRGPPLANASAFFEPHAKDALALAGAFGAGGGHGGYANGGSGGSAGGGSGGSCGGSGCGGGHSSPTTAWHTPHPPQHDHSNKLPTQQFQHRFRKVLAMC